jgi:hypothetical protein
MVVLAASILSRNGEVLLSRQFITMGRIRIEGLLASFPKLIGSKTQHTFVETDEVRYVYQPLDHIYIVLITTIRSNIMEDLETLRLLAKIIPDTCGGTAIAQINEWLFELIFSFDEVLALGHKEHVSMQQIKTYIEMDSHEEKLQKLIIDSKIRGAQEHAVQQADKIEKRNIESRKMAQLQGQGGSSGYGSGGNSYSSNSFAGESSSQSQSASHSSRGQSSSSYGPPAATVEKEPERRKVEHNKSKKPAIKGWSLGKKKKAQDDFLSQFAKEEKISKADMDRPLAPVSRQEAKQQEEEKQMEEVVHAGNPYVSVEEQLYLELDPDNEVRKFKIEGELKVRVFDPDTTTLALHTSGVDLSNKNVKFRLNPKLDNKAWKQGVVCLKDKTKQLPVGSENGTVMMKWVFKQTDDMDDMVPMTFSFWSNPEDGKTVVTLDYTHVNAALVMKDVEVTIPYAGEAPEFVNVDGEANYDANNGEIKWSIAEVSEENDSGTFEFSCEGTREECCIFPYALLLLCVRMCVCVCVCV